MLFSDDNPMSVLARHPAPAAAFFDVNLLIALTSLVPFPPRRKRGVGLSAGTDGWNLLSLPFRSRDRLAAMVAAHVSWEVERLVAAGKVAEANARVDAELKTVPTSLLARLSQTNLLITTERWADAAARLRALSSETGSGRDVVDTRWMVVNNLAWVDFMRNDRASLDEADRMSKEAVALSPRDPNVHGTRGAVLLARGDLASAREHLEFAVARNATASAKSLNACCLSIVHSKRGDVEAARSCLEEARWLDPMSALLARASVALASVDPMPRTNPSGVSAALDAGY